MWQTREKVFGNYVINGKPGKNEFRVCGHSTAITYCDEVYELNVTVNVMCMEYYTSACTPVLYKSNCCLTGKHCNVERERERGREILHVMDGLHIGIYLTTIFQSVAGIHGLLLTARSFIK